MVVDQLAQNYVDKLLALKPASLAIVEHCEFNLYKIEQELREKFPDIPIKLSLVSVTDEDCH